MARVPILHLGKTLIAAVLEELTDTEAITFQEELSGALEQTDADGILIDLTAVQTIDSFLGRMLNDTAAETRLLGAHTVVVGIQPAVAITLVELGLELKGVHTALNPDKGLRMLRRLVSADGRQQQ